MKYQVKWEPGFNIIVEADSEARAARAAANEFQQFVANHDCIRKFVSVQKAPADLERNCEPAYIVCDNDDGEYTVVSQAHPYMKAGK